MPSTSIPPVQPPPLVATPNIVPPPVGIKREIDKWKDENRQANLQLVALHEDQYRADLTIVLGEETCHFQVLFDDEWHPMVCVSVEYFVVVSSYLSMLLTNIF